MHLVLFCILSVLAYLAWLGYHYMRALGSAFGNVNHALGPSHVNVVQVLVAVATVSCIAGAMIASDPAASALALLPLLLMALGQGWFAYSERRNLHTFLQRQAAAKEAQREAKGTEP